MRIRRRDNVRSKPARTPKQDSTDDKDASPALRSKDDLGTTKRRGSAHGVIALLVVRGLHSELAARDCKGRRHATLQRRASPIVKTFTGVAQGNLVRAIDVTNESDSRLDETFRQRDGQRVVAST